MRGCFSRNAASCAGSTSAPIISLAVMRTDAALLLRFAGRDAREGIGGARHRLRVRHERQRDRGGDEARLRAREQRDAQRLLERVDVAADRRLGQRQASARRPTGCARA